MNDSLGLYNKMNTKSKQLTNLGCGFCLSYLGRSFKLLKLCLLSQELRFNF